MKKISLLLIILVLLVTGCGIDYKIHGHYVKLDEAVDFRHIHFKTSTSFDYGSDKFFKSYSLYDKRPNVLYSIVVNKVDGKLEDGVKSFEDKYKTKKESKKINRIKWIILTYTEDKKDYHHYFASYDDKEYYRIDFNNASLGDTFEKDFMKSIWIK